AGTLAGMAGTTTTWTYTTSTLTTGVHSVVASYTGTGVFTDSTATTSAEVIVYSRLAGAKYVQAVYRYELGRGATAADLDTWFGVLGGRGGRSAMADGMGTSVEARARLVTSWFQTYLGRTPDAATIDAFAATLAGQTEEQTISGILGSDEFYNRAQTLGF